MTTTTIHQRRPFNLRYVVRQAGGIHGDDVRATHRTAACNYLYIMRQNGVDEFGPTPDFAARRDLVAYGRRAPIAALGDAYADIKPWIAADDAARVERPDLATAMHAVGTLPPDGDLHSWRTIVQAFGDHLSDQGMIVDWAIHQLSDDAGGHSIPCHCHLLITARRWRLDRDPGHRQAPWLSTKAQVDRMANIWFELTGLYPVDYRKPAG